MKFLATRKILLWTVLMIAVGFVVYRIATAEKNLLYQKSRLEESAMSGLAIDQPARIVFRSEPSKSYPGKVVRLGREVDRETREFLADVRTEHLPDNWAVGQRAEVYIEIGRKSFSHFDSCMFSFIFI